MPVAAVPQYLGGDFSTAPPGLRFGQLLPIWTTREDQEREVRGRAKKKSPEGGKVSKLLEQHGMEHAVQHLCARISNPLPGLWEKNDAGATSAWNQAQILAQDHIACISALCERQKNLVCPDRWDVTAESTAPFVTGLGNEHPLENGFAFLNPYGLPYLPGSGVKGVLRRAAEELAENLWGTNYGWDSEPRYSLPINNVKLTPVEALFGREPPEGEKDQVRGALSFWDVYPQIKGDQLSMEVITPHQAHYYQGGESPHDSGNPIPILFLTVPAGSKFTFHVVCDRTRLERYAPDLAEGGRWKTLLSAAFKHAFEWLGFGAKTAVGYGAMRVDPRVEAEAARRAEEESKRRAQQEKERIRREAEQAKAARVAAAQAEFDALPESRKILIEAKKAIDAFLHGSSQDLRIRDRADVAASRILKYGPTWPQEPHREEAATLLESYYDAAGWHATGLKAPKREKQEKKKRDAIARIRSGG